MKKLLIILGLGLFSASVKAGPIIVGTGAGESEYSLVFVKSNWNDMARDCKTLSCQLSPAESLVFENITSRMKDKVLQFKNSRGMGTNLFLLHHEFILINQDLLWQDTAKTISYDAAEAFSLFIQILDSIAPNNADLVHAILEKVRLAYRQEVQRGSFQIPGGQTFEYVLWKRQNADDLFVIRDPAFQTLNLTTEVRKFLNCESPKDTVHAFSPVWKSTQLVPADLRSINLTVNFGLGWSCGGNQGSSFATAAVELQQDSQKIWTFNTSSLFVFVEVGGTSR